MTVGELALPLEGSDLVAICIPAATKPALMETLNTYGINVVALFPDLDGLSKHINWGTRKGTASVKRSDAASGALKYDALSSS